MRTDADAIARVLQDPDRHEFDTNLTSWSVLGIARMLYTARTGDVTSKSAAGEWLLDELPEHRALVEHALEIRSNETSEPDNRKVFEETATLINQVADLVAATDR